jgi:putative flippase GtrA
MGVTGIRRLLSPASGLVGQGVRYAVAGAFVALVYLLTTSLLAVVVGLPFREALPIGFTVQLAVHYTLQRTFVWVHDEDFALSFKHQARRYLTVAAAQLGITALTTSLLPGVLGLSTEVVYLMTAGLLVIANFLLFRNVVFHPEKAHTELQLVGTADAGTPLSAPRSASAIPSAAPRTVARPPTQPPAWPARRR